MFSEPLSYTLDGRHHEQESIIADIRSIGGYSGYPVFLNELGFVGRPDGGDTIKKHWLLGVDWGHVKMWSPVCSLDEIPIGTTQVNINSGMAGIVPAWKLLIMSDEATQGRKQDEDRYLSSKGATVAALDVSSPPSTDENPNH